MLKASFSATEDIKAKAEEYNISVGKVKLITCVLAIDSSLTFEEAAKMSVRDLLRIIQEDRNEIKEFFSEEIRQEYLRLKDHIKNEYMLKIKIHQHSNPSSLRWSLWKSWPNPLEPFKT